eukprot:tig00020614_g12143.t1
MPWLGLFLLALLGGHAQHALAQRAPHAHMRSVEGEAWITLATNSECVTGAVVLAYSLLKTNTTRQLVCMVTPEVPEIERLMLSLFFDRVVVVDPIEIPSATSPLGQGQVAGVFTKLRLFQLTEYKRLVWMDSDAIVVQNADELFDCHPPCGVIDMGLFQTTEFGVTVNGGVLVMRPSAEDFAELLRLSTPWDAPRMEYARTPGCFLPGKQNCPAVREGATYLGPLEQALLNRYFGSRFTVLPVRYDMMPLTMVPQREEGNRGHLWDAAGAKVLHFAIIKPWLPGLCDGIQPLCDAWWALRNEAEAFMKGPALPAPPAP